jgi:hypothetical protein
MSERIIVTVCQNFKEKTSEAYTVPFEGSHRCKTEDNTAGGKI